MSKGITTKGHFKEHARAHEGRGFSSDFCWKAPRYHTSEHTGKYRFRCQYCNKKVLLRERKRHTARHVASARFADGGTPSSHGWGGYPIQSWMGGTPCPRSGLRGGGVLHPILNRGYPRVSSLGWGGGYPGLPPIPGLDRGLSRSDDRGGTPVLILDGVPPSAEWGTPRPDLVWGTPYLDLGWGPPRPDPGWGTPLPKVWTD